LARGKVSLPGWNLSFSGARVLGEQRSNRFKTWLAHVCACFSSAAGRLVFELFFDITPKTAENFRELCTGERAHITSGNAPLHYKVLTQMASDMSFEF
jgi:hypothetical protein